MARHLIFPIALLLAACGGRGLPGARSETPVILISIDTLRSDRLPAYGYKGVATPNLDAFRADSILFERAYSHCPLTLPSHASVFTGQLPAETGIRDNTGYTLAANSSTLAEVLGRSGYATGAAVSAYVLRKGTGIERGFHAWDDDVGAERAGVTISSVQRDGAKTIAAAEQWLSANASKPFLYFLHLYEPHSPYEPPAEYRRKYSAYDGEIAYSDALVGRFLQRLKDLGVYDKALIVVFSDHGEGLNDHGEDEHGIFLYREALQVPLLVKLPDGDRRGESVAAPVQLSDIFPTVLAATGTGKAPQSAGNSRSLLDPPVKRQIYSESYFARFHFGWSDLHSLIDERHHYIRAPQPELYDVADAAEKQNVLESQRRAYAALRTSIEPLIKTAEAPKPVDAEEAAKLAALGYLGSAAQVEGPLPDPKTKIDTYRRIREAFGHFKAGRYAEALDFYQRLLRENPRMLDLWDVSARALVRLGRPAEAIAAAKEALKLSPHSSHLVILIATVALESGQLEDARQHAELALKSDPLQAHEILARVALARGDMEAAEREARAALEAQPNDARALMTLGRVAQEKKDFGAAVTQFDAAIARAKEKNTAISGLHFLRGDTLARLGRFGDAEAALRQEISLFPEDPQAYRSLILLYVTQNRNDDATGVIYELEKASPTPPSYATITETLRVIGDERGARYWAMRGLKRYPGNQTLRRLVG